jgi:acetyl esterase/lipase
VPTCIDRYKRVYTFTARRRTAVIVCPGGGFHSLSIMQEGYGVVKWLQSKGITAFLLKYRLMHIRGSDPYRQENEDRTRKAADTERAQAADMAIADGRRRLLMYAPMRLGQEF